MYFPVKYEGSFDPKYTLQDGSPPVELASLKVLQIDSVSESSSLSSLAAISPQGMLN